MKVVIAPDSFGGTLSAPDAARAIAAGWARERPEDELVHVPMSDGGEGLLDVLGAVQGGQRQSVEVAGPLGHPRDAAWLLLEDGTAVIASEEACGLRHVPPERRTPLRTTTWGVGQLLDAARGAGASRILLGLGGSATVDGGAGAVTALGWRVTVADGSGLKVGGADLHRVAAIADGWQADWSGVAIELLADVRTVLLDAPARFGPQKGAGAEEVPRLEAALRRWAEVVERDLDRPGLRGVAGTGAAGGLGFGLAAALDARFVSGVDRVADLAGLATALHGADLVVTGEGRLDATSAEGKVVGSLLDRAGRTPVMAVVGGVTERPGGLTDVEASAPDGPGPDPTAEVAAAAARLASRLRALS